MTTVTGDATAHPGREAAVHALNRLWREALNGDGMAVSRDRETVLAWLRDQPVRPAHPDREALADWLAGYFAAETDTPVPVDVEHMTDQMLAWLRDQSARAADADRALDGFATEVRRVLAEAIEDGAEGDELRDTVTEGVRTLLTCHWCGAAGLPPCCEDDADAAVSGRADTEGSDRG